MTRSQAIDENQVNILMSAIEEEDYLPDSPVWVNAVSGADGEVIHYRLIAGRHRLEACRRLGMEEIPALIFYDLSDEEECIADRVSNQKDGRHKKVSYMEEARHCLYLQDTKGWSTRQIAAAKGISRTAVKYKIQVAKLPEKVTDTFVTGHNVTIPESYFREICKLKAEPHQMMVCKKIIGDIQDTSNNSKEQTEQAESKITTAPDVKKMVRELLLREAQGEIAEEAMKFFKDEGMGYINSIHIIEATEEINITETIEDVWQKIIENSISEESDKREKGMRYSNTPMWFKHCTGVIDLPLSSSVLLAELISNDLRFKPDKDTYFFITPGNCYENTEGYLATVINVKERTLMKKILPSITKYIDYRKPGDVLKFKVKWNRLFELYKKQAHKIPFNDGGLAGIPESFTGRVYPTPYHCLLIENGQVKQDDTSGEKKDVPVAEQELEIPALKEILPALKTDIKEEIPMFRESEKHSLQETSPEDMTGENININKEDPENTNEEYLLSSHPVEVTLKKLGMAEKQIRDCVSRNNIDTTLNILKYINEMSPGERDNIKNLPGYIYGMVKKGFSPPENFETYQETAERAVRRKTVYEVGSFVMQGFKGGKIKLFCPKPDVELPLVDVPNEGTFIFTCDKGIRAGSFGKWPDEKYFR